mmetsp:Transcript_13469/g.50126  ORF Transcript_13469/g.50126 Transcript_13469/m.50126 type:complete len:151 (-) Transcript_13469:11-463(-)
MSFAQAFPSVGPVGMVSALSPRNAEEFQRYQRKLVADMQQQATAQSLRGNALGALSGNPAAVGQLGLGFFPAQANPRPAQMPNAEEFAARQLRRGKWTTEEENYAKMLIECFKVRQPGLHATECLGVEWETSTSRCNDLERLRSKGECPL